KDMSETTVVAATSREQLDVVRELLREYQARLGVDLSFQGFESELRELPGSYSPPRGRLLLGVRGGTGIGCVALRPLDGGRCEIKRLFVRPSFRGSGVGRVLVSAVLSEARAVGYAEVVLDTLPHMEEAQQLYRKFGFRDIPGYYPNPIPGSRYL